MKTIKRLNRKILDILSYCETREDKIKESTMLAANFLDCDIYFMDINFNFISASNDDLESTFFENFKNIDLQRENIEIDGKYFIATPLVSSRENLGFFVAKKDSLFEDTDIVIFEIFRNFCVITLNNINRDKNFKKQRELNIVKNSISSFSYSELHAIISIFNELEGTEGVVVASNVSEKYSVTRSVIVSALRKFESSGVIESRSLGAKGTFIKILNPFLLDELEKIKGDFIYKK